MHPHQMDRKKIFNMHIDGIRKVPWPKYTPAAGRKGLSTRAANRAKKKPVTLPVVSIQEDGRHG